MVLLRNDDISWDSDVSKLKEIQKVFEKFGLKEMYSVIPFGKTIYDGEYSPEMREQDIPTGTLPITWENEVCDFIKHSLKRGHRISMHGWRHTRITDYSENELLANIKEGKDFLEDTFDTCITHFIAPFNHYDDRVIKVCEKLDLELSIGGLQLEKAVENDIEPSEAMWWYHYWRLDAERLEKWLTHFLKTEK